MPGLYSMSWNGASLLGFSAVSEWYHMTAPLVVLDGPFVFFRGGARATWHVERYVKKVAFLRQTNPIGFGLAIHAVNRLKRMLSKSPAPMLVRLWMPVVIP